MFGFCCFYLVSCHYLQGRSSYNRKRIILNQGYRSFYIGKSANLLDRHQKTKMNSKKVYNKLNYKISKNSF